MIAGDVALSCHLPIAGSELLADYRILWRWHGDRRSVRSVQVLNMRNCGRNGTWNKNVLMFVGFLLVGYSLSRYGYTSFWRASSFRGPTQTIVVVDTLQEPRNSEHELLEAKRNDLSDGLILVSEVIYLVYRKRVVIKLTKFVSAISRNVFSEMGMELWIEGYLKDRIRNYFPWNTV